MTTSPFVITALSKDATMLDALAAHWREYLMEASELGLLMLMLCTCGVLIYSGQSPLAVFHFGAAVNSALMGAALAGSMFLIIRSPMGRRSGAHFNPALTIAYFSIGRMHRLDAFWYLVAQFLGGIGGVALAKCLLRNHLANWPVLYVATLPGSHGPRAAFLAVFAASTFAMEVILISTNSRRASPYSPAIVALATVLCAIAFRPFAAYSVNPARTLSSAVFAYQWNGLWIYLVAPILGTVAAIWTYKKAAGPERIFCAKVYHDLHSSCPFDCRFHQLHQ
jgi:aquaporin Z